MRSRLASILSFFVVVGLSAAAQAESITYLVDADLSTASVTFEYNGVAIGSGSFDVTGSYVTFDADAGSLSDFEIVFSSIDTILLSESLDLGDGLIDSIFVDSATMTDAGAFTTITYIPGAYYSSSGSIDVTGDMTTNLGMQAFDLSDSMTISPLLITGSDPDTALHLSGFTLTAFDVYDEFGNVVGSMTMKIDMSVLATAPVPEPSAAVLYMISFAVVTPFFRRRRHRGAGAGPIVELDRTQVSLESEVLSRNGV